MAGKRGYGADSNPTGETLVPPGHGKRRLNPAIHQTNGASRYLTVRA